jgi:Mitochondrial ATPase expression
MMRNAKPVVRLYRTVTNGRCSADERIMCSLMVAFARTGSLKAIRWILRTNWGIIITVRNRQLEIEESSFGFPPGSPLALTERLLDAIVTSFCTNGEVAIALQLVAFASRPYDIPISNRLWFRLFEWTYIQSTKPASTEWKIVDWESRIVPPDAVQQVWDVMMA